MKKPCQEKDCHSFAHIVKQLTFICYLGIITMYNNGRIVTIYVSCF